MMTSLTHATQPRSTEGPTMSEVSTTPAPAVLFTVDEGLATTLSAAENAVGVFLAKARR